MKSFLRHRSNRWGHDGWALACPDTGYVFDWSTCTTREECRQLRREKADLFERGAQIVKVRIKVEAADG